MEIFSSYTRASVARNVRCVFRSHPRETFKAFIYDECEARGKCQTNIHVHLAKNCTAICQKISLFELFRLLAVVDVVEYDVASLQIQNFYSINAFEYRVKKFKFLLHSHTFCSVALYVDIT